MDFYNFQFKPHKSAIDERIESIKTDCSIWYTSFTYNAAPVSQSCLNRIINKCEKTKTKIRFVKFQKLIFCTKCHTTLAIKTHHVWRSDSRAHLETFFASVSLVIQTDSVDLAIDIVSVIAYTINLTL